MRIQRACYDILINTTAALAGAAARFNGKIAEGLEGRKGIRERWEAAASGLDRGTMLIWFHVSSVGEYLQAKPVMDMLTERMGSGLNIALSFYSPSGLNYFDRHDRSKRNPSIRFVDYLPADTRGNACFCLDTLRPDMLIYVKFDLWPNLIFEASGMGIPQILISGTLAPNSRRLSRIARGFYGNLYSNLTAIAAISDEDAERFRKHMKNQTEIITAGDTRFDQVCQRIDTKTVRLPAALSGSSRPFLIAGSTWPRDEDVVIPGFRRLLDKLPEVCLIIVPHEPTPARLREIEKSLEREKLRFHLLSTLDGTRGVEEPVVIADGLGYLAELYRAGCIAYVGGSFTTGVHNVMEPAVLGLPVIFGPRIDNSYEARKLVELEAARIVHDPEDFEREAATLLSNRELLEKRGGTGSLFIRNHCGAALRCVDLIEKHLARRKVQGE